MSRPSSLDLSPGCRVYWMRLQRSYGLSVYPIPGGIGVPIGALACGVEPLRSQVRNTDVRFDSADFPDTFPKESFSSPSSACIEQKTKPLAFWQSSCTQ